MHFTNKCRKNKYFPKNLGDPPGRTSPPTFGSRPTVWETLAHSNMCFYVRVYVFVRVFVCLFVSVFVCVYMCVFVCVSMAAVCVLVCVPDVFLLCLPRCPNHPTTGKTSPSLPRHILPRYATIQIVCCLTFCPQRKSRCTPCDLECMTEFSRRQTTGCVELFLLACYILITRAYERILPCMYCITMYVTQNAVCNCEIKLILTYLLIFIIVGCIPRCYTVYTVQQKLRVK